MTELRKSDFMLEVAKGNVPGHSAVNKFGHNPLATSGDDIWGGTGVYGFFPTTAQSMEAVSSSANDSSAGTGARTVQVYGLDANWDLQEETVTLNGTTPVALANTYIRLFRTIVLTVGTSPSNEGAILVRISGGGTTGIYIGINEGQTQHAIYTIPNGYTGFFIKGYVGVADSNKNGESAEFQWKARPNNGVNGAWAVKGEIGLNTLASSWWQYEYGIPAGALPEKTDIRIETVTMTASMGVVGGFDLLLVEDGY